MGKYLDENGLKYLWSKIETKMESLTKEIVMISLSTNQGGGGNDYCYCDC